MGKGPTRRQGTGKAPEKVRAIKKASREHDPFLGKRRGGYHEDPSVYRRSGDDTSERLDEYLAEEEEEEQPVCNSKACKEARAVPEAHVCRWVCLCGNLIREDEQHPQLKPQTLRAVGTCCAGILPDHLKNSAMPIAGVEEVKPQALDQRHVKREEEPS